MFERDGFLVVENLVKPQSTKKLIEHYQPFFEGRFPTGISPEKWTRIGPNDDNPTTRWAEKAWRSDPAFAAFSLQSQPAQMIALLSGWQGARLFIDAAHWKPPGAGRVGFHQDNSYMRWANPSTMNAVWIALDDVTANRAPMIYTVGSHKWKTPDSDDYRAKTGGGVEAFLESDDFSGAVEAAAKASDAEVQFKHIVLPAGGAVFHNGWTWHASEANTDTSDRISLSIHCMPHDTQYSADINDPIESRYKRPDSLIIDDAYFPVLWTSAGERSTWVDDYVRKGLTQIETNNA